MADDFNPQEVLYTALIKSAASVAMEVVSKPVKAGAEKLKGLWSKWKGKSDVGTMAVNELEKDPKNENWQNLLRTELEKADAEVDDDLIEAARQLLDAIDDEPETSKQIDNSIRIENVQNSPIATNQGSGSATANITNVEKKTS
ncbi:MAG: hypothetical protein AAF585_12220 [Verrucomicrobiota bacterium]